MKFFNKKFWQKKIAAVCVILIMLPSFSVSAQSFFKNSRTTPTVFREKLVSILVEENLLQNSELKEKIERYAQDVQNTLNATAVLVEIPYNFSPKEIFEGNASLYFSGLENDQLSQLIGTVLIGDIPIPFVNKKGQNHLTIFPYTDFENVNYVWDFLNEKFVWQGGDEQPEIWHGIIKSDVDTGNLENDKKIREQELNNFFDQNHKVHIGEEKFAKKVFYVDLFQQKLGLPQKLKESYNLFIKYFEDTIYQRFTSKWSKELLENLDFESLIPTELLPREAKNSQEITTEGMPDIFSKNVIESMMKRYFEFYKGFLSEINSRIANAGRWKPEEIDTTITLVSRKDEWAGNILRSFNDDIEEVLFAEVGSKIAKNIRLISPSEILTKTTTNPTTGIPTINKRYFPKYWNGIELFPNGSFNNDFTVEDCSLIRGINGVLNFSQQIEANRVFDLTNINNDQGLDLVHCFGQTDDSNNEVLLTSQCRFELFGWNFGKSSAQISDTYFQNEKEPLLSLNSVKDTESVQIGAKGCEPILYETFLNDNTGFSVPSSSNIKSLSSLVNHIEPTQRTIKTQFSSMTESPAIFMPIDNPRGFSFYYKINDEDPTKVEYKFTRISYPNIFDLREKFREESDLDRKNLLENELENFLTRKITELNNLQTDENLELNLFAKTLEKFDIKKLVDAIIWLDEPIADKNIEMLIGGLSSELDGRQIFHNKDFNGYEVIEILGEKTNLNGKTGLKIAFEQGHREPPTEFLEAQIEDLSFNFLDTNNLQSSQNQKMFSQIFAKNYEETNNSNNKNNNCNRNILTWTTSCLVPWLKDLPKTFSEFISFPSPNIDESKEYKKTETPTSEVNIFKYLEVSPTKIINSVNNSQPQIIEVKLFDKDNNLLTNDFSTEISIAGDSDFSRFFTLLSDKKQIVNGGIIKFFLNPIEQKFGGKFNLKVSANNEEKIIPVIITNENIEIFSEDDFAKAGDGFGIKIEGKILDTEEKISRKFDGKKIQVSTSNGSFENNEIIISNGSFLANYLPGEKAGKEQIKFSNQSLNLPEIISEITILPNSPTQILLKNNLKYLVNNGDFVEIKAFMSDYFGNEIEELNNSINISGENLEIKKDENGKISIKNIAKNKTTKLFLDSEKIDTKKSEIVFEILENPQITIQKNFDNLMAGSTKKSILNIKILDNEGNLIDGNFHLNVSSDNDFLVSFAKEVFIKNGQGQLEISPKNKAGKLNLSIFKTGFLPQNIDLNISSNKAEKIKLFYPKTINIDDENHSEVVVKVFDKFGNFATNFNENIYVKINPNNLDDKEIENSNTDSIIVNPKISKINTKNANFFASNINLQNGEGILKIHPNGKLDELFLIAEKENLISAVAKIDLVKILEQNDFNHLSPKSLLTIISGFEAGNLQSSNFANRLIFSGKTQAVLTQIENEKEKFKEIVKISANGNLNENLNATLFTSKKPTFLLSSGDKNLAKISLNLTNNPVFRLGSISNTDNLQRGVYLVPNEDEGLNLDDKVLTLNDEKILEFNELGGLNFLHKNLNLIPYKNSFLRWEIFFREKSLGIIYFYNEEAKISFENKDAEIFVETLSPNIFLKNTFSGGSNHSEKGVSIFDKNFLEKNNIGFSQSSISDIIDDKNLGWKGNWKPATLFSAGNNIGDSAKLGASDNLVIIGDPTLSLQDKNTPKEFKITEDLGINLWKSSQDNISQILAGDLNDNGRKEIFSLVDEELFIFYHDEKELYNFRENGIILRFEDGVKNLDIYENSKQKLIYIIQLNKNGQLIFHKNVNGTLQKEIKKFGQSSNISKFKVGKINGDKFRDILFLDSNNTLWVAHGKEDLDFYEPQKFYNFSPKFSPISEKYNPKNSSKNFNYLTEFIVLDSQNEKIRLTKNPDFSADLSITNQKSSSDIINQKIAGKLILTPSKNFAENEIFIPNVQGIENLESSFVCENCEIEKSKDGFLLNLKNIKSGKKIIITWEGIIFSVPSIDFLLEDFAGEDNIDDIAVPWINENKEKQFIKFLSNNNNKQYPKKEFKNSAATNFAKNNFPSSHSLKIDEAFPDLGNDLVDKNYQAVADSTLEILKETAYGSPSIDLALKSMSCGSGGCGLPIPSYAFLAPGSQSIYLPPFGVPGPPSIGLPALWIGSIIPFVYGGPPLLSFFRLYVSPTITGQVGISICLGPKITAMIPPVLMPNCFVVIPPFLELLNACPANLLNIENSPALEALSASFLLDGGASFSPPPATKNTNAKIKTSNVILQWVQDQFDEFSNFKFPQFNMILPKFLQKNSRKNSANKSKKTSLDVLKNSPFIDIKKKNITISYPNFEEKKLKELKSSWKVWKKGYPKWKCETKGQTLNTNTNECESIFGRKNKSIYGADVEKILHSTRLVAKAQIIEKSLSNSFISLSQNISGKEDIDQYQILVNEVKNIEKEVSSINVVNENSRNFMEDQKKSVSISQQKSEGNFNQIKTILGEPTDQNLQLKTNYNQKTETKKIDSKFTEIFLKFTGIQGITDLIDNNIVNFDKNLKSFTSYQVLFAKCDQTNKYEREKCESQSLLSIKSKLNNLTKKAEKIANFINEYFVAWVNSTKRSVNDWKTFETNLSITFKTLNSIPEIFSSLTKSCPSCNINRGSMIEWLMNILLGSIKFPVLKLPKIPDVNIDMSGIKLGYQITIPDIKAQPVNVLPPDFPKLPNLDLEGFYDTFFLKIINSVLNFDWNTLIDLIISDQNFTAILKKLINGEISAKLFLDKIDELLDKSFDATLDSLLLGLDNFPNFNDVLAEIPKIPVFPPLPNLNLLNLEVDLKNINLPKLPTILPPPIFPNFLKPLQAILEIPKPFFQLFCLMILGIIPIPEWKVASRIQEATNRTSLIPLDFATNALAPINSKKSPKPINLKQNIELIPALDVLNKQVEKVKSLSDCVVDKVGNISRGGESSNCLLSQEKTENKILAKNLETETVNILEEIPNSVSQKEVKILKLKNTLLAKKNVKEINLEKTLAKLFKPNEDYNLKRKTNFWTASADFVSNDLFPKKLTNEENFNLNNHIKSEINNLVPIKPKINYYDKKTDSIKSITNYNLENSVFNYLFTDLDFDGEKEILFSLNRELYLKVRHINVEETNKNRSPKNKITKLNIEDFTKKIIPTLEINQDINSVGDQINFESFNKTENYLEWKISERPDFIFENDEIFSREIHRIGFINRPNSQKYQIRKSTAQIKNIKGAPKIIGSKMNELPNFKNSECENDDFSKPFFPSKTILVAGENNTRFQIITKKRQGEDQKSYWKTINIGEETLVDFAEICVIQGSLLDITVNEIEEFIPQKNDYFLNNMQLVLGEKDEVEIEFFNGKNIVVNPNETYEIIYLENLDKEIYKFKKLKKQNNYGSLFSENDENKSALISKLLHDPSNIYDKNPPEIIIQNGTIIKGIVGTKTIIDASKSFDDDSISQIKWTTNIPNFDTTSIKNLELEIPPQSLPNDFEINLELKDSAGNISRENLTLSIKYPEIVLKEVLNKNSKLWGTISPKIENIIIDIFRKRNNRKVKISKTKTDKDGVFVLENLTKNGKVEIWKKNPDEKIIEILPTSRPIILNNEISYKIRFADENRKFGLDFFNQKQEKIGELDFNYIGQGDIKISTIIDNNENSISVSQSINKNKIWKYFSNKNDFEGAIALMDLEKNSVDLVIDKIGNIYNLNSDISFKIKPTFKDEDPLVFETFEKNEKFSEVFIPTENFITVE